MNKYSFVEDKIKEIKQEIRDRKKWRTALKNEYCKARTFKYNQQGHIINMIKVSNIMIKYNEEILNQYKLMLKELKESE